MFVGLRVSLKLYPITLKSRPHKTEVVDGIGVILSLPAHEGRLGRAKRSTYHTNLHNLHDLHKSSTFCTQRAM